MIDKLDHLAATGITAIELMPLADFPGRWNWGYDGVLPFAPDSVYGRPDDLKALIDAAHERDLMVFLDVVYNHFGPEGNYLHRIAPQFFSEAADALGRRHRLHAATRYALSRSRTRCTGCVTTASTGCASMPFMRLPTAGTPHLLHDLSIAAGRLAAQTGRHIHLVLENDDNCAALLDPSELVPRGRYRVAMERRLSPRVARAADRTSSKATTRTTIIPASG